MTILKLVGFPLAILYIAISFIAVTMFPLSKYIYQTRLSKYLISEPPSEVFLPLMGLLVYCMMGPILGIKLFIALVGINHGLPAFIFIFSIWSKYYDRYFDR